MNVIIKSERFELKEALLQTFVIEYVYILNHQEVMEEQTAQEDRSGSSTCKLPFVLGEMKLIIVKYGG